jgi:hypothetical protein
MTCGSGAATFPTAEQAKILSRNFEVIWAEIAAIQAAILKATSGCYCVDGNPVDRGGKFCVIVSDDTPMTMNRGISAITVTAPGQDYFPVVATATFARPNNAIGVDAFGTVIVSPAGTVASISIENGGLGYNTAIATVDTTAMLGINAILTPVVNALTGAITSVIIIDAGIQYQPNEPIPIVGNTAGTGANITVGTVDALTGAILTVVITSGGVNYQPIPATVTVHHPIGQGFVGLVQVTNGAVTGVSVQNGGILYGQMMPSVELIDIVGNGSGAETYTTVDATTGALTGVTVTNAGVNYSASTTGIVIPAPTSTGTGATVSVTASPNPYGTDPYLYYLALIGQLDNCGIKDQIEQVKNYFIQLGYMIEAQVNPDTNATIQWEICWC